MGDRRFPVLWQGDRAFMDRLRDLSCPRSVPWSLVEPDRRQAKRNHSQTLERLAQRGGLSPHELLATLEGRDLRTGSDELDLAAVPILLAHLDGAK